MLVEKVKMESRYCGHPLPIPAPVFSSEMEYLFQSELNSVVMGLRIPPVAHRVLENMDKALENEVNRSLLSRQYLTEKYYFPMLEASIECNHLDRALTLWELIKESLPYINKDWLHHCWLLNITLNFLMHNLDGAKQSAKTLADLAEKNKSIVFLGYAFHAFGVIAMEQRKFKLAKKWFSNFQEIIVRTGNRYFIPIIYLNLGTLAAKQGKHNRAKKWYRKSMELEEQFGNTNQVSILCTHMGIISAKQQDFEDAERWCWKSLNIDERNGNEDHTSVNYSILGLIFMAKQDYSRAEKWIRNSLIIDLRLGNTHHASKTYLHLAIIALKKRDFPLAENWCRQSLEIRERLGDGILIIMSILKLCAIHCEMGNDTKAHQLFMNGIKIFKSFKNKYSIKHADKLFRITLKQIPNDIEKKLRELYDGK